MSIQSPATWVGARHLLAALALSSLAAFGATSEPAASAKPAGPAAKPEFPPHTDVFKGYQEVVSRGSTNKSLMSIWIRPKDGQMLAAFSPKYPKQRFFIAMTVASGEEYAGLQAREIYGYWRRYDKRLALIEPNLAIRSNGELESRESVKRLFTDRVVVDVPIVTVLPKWGPVIDMDELLVRQAAKFFVSGETRGMRPQLATIRTAEAFPQNVELSFEVPVQGGQLRTFHYSISTLPAKTGYKPRKADERIGYFTTTYQDLGEYEDVNTVRYINRWHLEKADPKLQISPPKNPITFYIEHTTPIRYRRWVRQGILYWNAAFEKVGIANAIEVNYQDAVTGAHMEKHPEDVRWNFIRWLNNNAGTAIGPSRVDPNTGQILDADVILTDGWVRHYWKQFNEVLPELAMEGFSPKTLAWLEKRPQWDPRIRLADPSQRSHLLAQRQRQANQPYARHPLARVDPAMIGDDEYDGLAGRISQLNGLCRAAECKALDMAMMRFNLDLLGLEAGDEEGEGDDGDAGEEGEEPKTPEEKLDGIPEWFVGPLLAELVCHEVGHTLGLRHNFKASSVYSLDQINSEETKGTRPFAGSVMDYLPVNMYVKDGKKPGEGEGQGDFSMIHIGPYDHWAIEYGYAIVKKDEELKPILARVGEPELAFATDEDTAGPDPLARRYDFAKDPLAYAENQMALARYHRERILDEFVKEGQSWARARRGYEMTLAAQQRALSMMANWLGGSFVNRDKKGDPDGRPPLSVVPAKQQRKALAFVLRNAFQDEAYGLTPELLRHMTLDKWWDDFRTVMQDPTWPVHDRVAGIQSSVLTMLLNPTTLERVYDNEFYTPEEEDMITLPEVLDDLRESIFTELRDPSGQRYTARRPMVSSLRRVLQGEFIERLIDLSLEQDSFSVSSKPIADLATMHLRTLVEEIEEARESGADRIDPYTRAHLSEASRRITAALEASYSFNGGSGGGLGGGIFILGREEAVNGLP